MHGTAGASGGAIDTCNIVVVCFLSRSCPIAKEEAMKRYMSKVFYLRLSGRWLRNFELKNTFACASRVLVVIVELMVAVD